MIKSMTGYSRSSLGSFVIEIHSVNRKMLDFVLHLPKNFLRFDVEIRKLLSSKLERGQITFRLTVQERENGLDRVLASQLKIVKQKWEELCLELKLQPEKEISLEFLVAQLSSSTFLEEPDEKEIWSQLQTAIVEGLEQLIQMKLKEGKALSLDIEKRLKHIEELTFTIEERKEAPLIHYRKMLLDRLKEMTPALDERIEREIVLVAEKTDITEEIVRLRAHIDQFRHYLAQSTKSVGRTLDFLTQEMHREINTLGSKSCDTQISQGVVAMKSELEKIREQVQNIE